MTPPNPFENDPLSTARGSSRRRFIKESSAIGIGSIIGISLQPSSVYADESEYNWEGQEQCSLPLSKDEYKTAFKQDLGSDLETAVAQGMGSLGGTWNQVSHFTLISWINIPTPAAIVGDMLARATEMIAYSIAEKVTEHQADSMCVDINREFNASAAVAEADDPDKVNLSNPDLEANEGPGTTHNFSVTLDAEPLTGAVEAILEMAESVANSLLPGDGWSWNPPPQDEPEPGDGKVKKLLAITKLSAKASGSYKFSVKTRNTSQFDGVQGNGTITKSNVPKDGSADIFRLVTVAWEYSGSIEFTTPIGDFTLSFEDIYVDVQLNADDAAKVTVRE